MKKYNLFIVILLVSLVSSCEQIPSDFFSINESLLKAEYTSTDSVLLEILNPQAKKTDSIVYLLNNKKVGVSKANEKFKLPLLNQKLGLQKIKASVYFEGEKEVDSVQIEVVSGIQPKLISYTIVNTYPHDIEAYTQGLEFYKDTLYEGTGNGMGPSGKKGISSLRKVAVKTGKVLKKLELPEAIFGEGITILNNKLYQLTWQNNEGYVYDPATFKKEKTFPYFKTMEGWGLTSDGKNLYMTDSSERIHILNPETFTPLDYINVYSGSTKVEAVNELEWIEGKIFGNVYQKDAIAIINPKTGAVEGIIDLSALKKKVTQLIDTDVLNGIAYNPKTKTIFVTGKNWDKMFEIKIAF